MKNNFEIKKRLVLEGKSKIFADWSAHSNITQYDFLDALEWLCDDTNMTREIGLTPTGIVKLKRVYHSDNSFDGFFLDGIRWNGAFFERPCTEDEILFYGYDSVKELQKISLSCKDRI